MATPNTNYIIYSSPASVANIDKNVPENSDRTPKPSQFPRRLYKGEPFGVSKTQPYFFKETGSAMYPRDKNIDYTIFVDRETHPEHFSRFGYGWCPNGYCFANMPGRYNTPPSMRWMSDILPDIMAPQRFYEGKQIDPNHCDSEAYINSRAARYR